MKKHRWSRERQQQFLEYLAETGNVSRAAKLVGSSTARVYAMRHNDPAFRQGWDEAEEIAADRLEAEAWRRAVVGPLQAHVVLALPEQVAPLFEDEF